METVALLYEDYQKELAEDFKNTFLKRASDTDSSRSNDTVIDEVTDMLSTNIAVYTEKLLQRWGFSSGGEGGGGGDVTVTLDDLLKKYLSDNYVTIKGDQEVFGEKDFRKGIRIAGRRLYWDEGNDALVIEGAAYTTRWLSAKGVSPGGGGAGSGGAAAMYQLIDVSPNDTKDAVLGAEKDYVLTFDGSFWRGMPNKGGLSSKLFTALDKEGNEVNPDDENAEIYAIRANYSLWSVGFLSAKGISDGGTGGGGGGAVALYQLLDVEKNADITGVAGATKGSVLTFNGDKWYADKPKTAAGISNLFTALDNDGNEVDLNDESKLGTITNIRANYALWSVDWISAKGKSSGGSGGGGGLINLVYGFESLGGTFDNNDNSATFNAFTINEIWKLASSGLTNVTVTGSGNAVTDVIKGSDGRSLTFTKGSTFATKSEFDALNTKFNDFLTGSDADDIINKWSELEVFLQGMKESDNLAVILQSKMDKTAFSKLFTALDASGNEVDPSDDTKTIASIRANFGFWGVDYISAKGVSKGSGGTGGASTLYQLVDVLANDTEDGVEGAAAGKALVFDGIHWRAGDAGLNESQLYSYLTANKYLTQSAADSRYVTSSRKVIAGTGLSGGGALTSDVTLSLGTSGVVAGTYTKVMVDAYGRVTVGDNPTTLAGYGITDAYTKTEADGKYVTIATPQNITGQKTFTQQLKSTVATGTAPLIVNSTTLVSNLNSNYLQGYNYLGFIHSNYSASTGGTAYVSGDTHMMLVAEINIDTTYSTYVILLSNEFWGHQHYSALQLHIACTNNDNSGNKSPRCSVHVMSLVGSHTRGVRYKIENNKAYIFIEVYGGNGYGRWASTILQNYNNITTNNANTTGNITLRFAFNQANSGLRDASYVNYISSTGLATSRTLWGQPFNGTANVSGDMTGVGNINMSGVLTIKNSTYNKQLIIRSAGSTAKNQGEGIWFRCDDVIQEVILRHEWYDTFVPGYGLAVSKHDSLEAGDANMFFYNTGRFISKAPQGTSPYQCVSTTVNVNLNADLLDGVHLAGLSGREGVMRSWLRGRYTTVNQYFGNGNVVTIDPKPTDDATLSANTTVLSLGDAPTRNTQLAFHYDTNTIKYRRHDGSKWNDWVVLIHSGNYAHYSDGRYVKKAGDTMTGDLNISGGHILYMLQTSPTSTQQIHLQGGSNDYGRIAFGATAGNAGWMEIASCDDGNEPIYARQYTGVFTSIKRTATLLDASGNTSFPGSVTSVRHISTVGTGTQPYQCNSTTLNTNLNADLLDNWHIADIPRNYNSTATYSLQFALGGTDNNWRKIFACSESGTGPWRSVTVWGQIWYAYGNHAQEEVRNYHFCAIFQMRSGETSSGSGVGSVVNSARLYLPTFAKGMDNIRLVRVGTNNFELQVRQIGSYHNGHIQYQYWANGANVSAWENLQSTSNTSVAVSAGGASTLADSRASIADVLTTSRTLWGRPFNGSANIDGNIDNAAVITSKGGIWLDLKGSSGVAFYAGGSLCAVMKTTGVGIGTSSPSQKLHVAGNIIATGAITAKASSSDIRLKTDIQGYDAMGIIRKFRSVKYHWNAIAKENSEVFNHDNWNYGLIAQDLLSGGYSQWVKDAFNDYYTIDYERLIPVVWKGLQEVDDEVTKLKREVARLNKRVKELEKSLCA